VVIGFFSLSESKRSPYIMPIAPAVAWLASGIVLGWIDGKLSRRRKKAMLAVTSFGTMLLVLLGLYAIVKGVERFPELQSVLWPLTVIGILGLAGWIWALPAKNRTALPVVWTATWALLWLYFAAVLLPAVDPLKSARGAALQIEQEIPAEVPLAGYRWWIWRSGARFYSGREISHLPDAFAAESWWNEPGARCIAVPGRHREEAISRLGLRNEKFDYRIGGRRSFVYCREFPLEPGFEESPGPETHKPADE
jgi:4-amino-4-deoxy-L-arabinose transferase-like glycosyltransferase